MIPIGAAKPVTVLATELVAVSISETVVPPVLVMPTKLPSGLTATPSGAVKPVMVAVTAPVAMSITETELAPVLAT